MVVASELAHSGGKASRSGTVVKTGRTVRKLVLTGLAFALSGLAFANPQGGNVVVGSATISQTAPNTMVINQQTNKVGIDWQSFNIKPNETVQFVQPSASSVALNRVVGPDASQIFGVLKANGQVFLTNPNGVIFAPGSRADVGGLLATTLRISNQDFVNGNYKFSANAGDTPASVVNQGELRSTNGYVVLAGNQVRNEGQIYSELGTVALAAGNAVTVTTTGNHLVSLEIDQGTVNALAENKGLIQANGGLVLLTAQSLDKMKDAVVNNTGIVEAQTLQNQSGRIYLLSSDSLELSGRLDASAPAGGNGGFVETSAPTLQFNAGLHVTTKAGTANGKSGKWLIDPTDFHIDANTSGTNSRSATDLANDLSNGDITIQTSSTGTGKGDIYVDAPITWDAKAVLTLNAANNIYINKDITATNSNGKLSLEYGQQSVASGNTADYSLASGVKINLQNGQNFSTKLGSDGTVKDYTVIDSLASIPASSYINFALGTDVANSGSTMVNDFRGSFTGLGHTVKGININEDTTVGLFNQLKNENTVIRDLKGEGNIAANSGVGALVGESSGSIAAVDMSGVTLTIKSGGGGSFVGGLVGRLNTDGTIRSDSRGASMIDVSAAATSGGNIGGLVGMAFNTTFTGFNLKDITIKLADNSAYIGGLVGTLQDGSIVDSHVESSVKFTGLSTAIASSAGGLVGWWKSVSSTSNLKISNSSAAVDVLGDSGNSISTGGLVGLIQNVAGATMSIDGSSASGNVSGYKSVGGLIGFVDNTDGGPFSVTNSSATGNVTASNSFAGGFVGRNAGNSSSYTSNTASGNVVTTGLLAGGFVGGDGFFTPDVDYLGGGSGTYTSNTASGNVTSAGNLAGGFAGYSETGTFTKSTASGSAVTGAVSVGGFIGRASAGTTLDGVTASGKVTGYGNVGGLVGHNLGRITGGSSAKTVTISSTGGDVTNINSTNIGGLVGKNNGTATSIASDSVGAQTITVDSTKSAVGGLIGLNLNGAEITGLTAANVTVNANGASDVGGLVGLSFGNIKNSTVASTVTINGGGSKVGGLVGTIATDASILSSQISGSSSAASVNATGTNAGGLVGYANIGAAGGSISILDSQAQARVSGGTAVGGLVGATNSSLAGVSQAILIKGDTVLSGSTVSGKTNVGGIVGEMDANTAVGLMTIGDLVVSGTDNVGGLVGHNMGLLNGEQAINSIKVNASAGSNTGGLIGLNDGVSAKFGIKENTTSIITVTTDANSKYVGGLIGANINGAEITGITPKGTVTVNANGASNVGGLVGLAYGTISDSVVGSSVSINGGGDNVGGLVGKLATNSTVKASSITNSKSAANVNATGTAAGGLIGYAVLENSDGTITVSGTNEASGFVRGAISVGGFVGATNASASATAGAITLKKAVVNGTAASGQTNVGGFAGEIDAKTIVSGATSIGSVNGTSNVGGFVGHNLGQISGSSVKNLAVSAVSGTNIGGFVGKNDGTSASISSDSTVASTTINADSKTTNVGGWVGTNVNGAVINAISVSDITINANGASNVGGLAGSSYGTISNSTVAKSVTINGAGNNTGGLVGQLGTDSTALISNVTNSSSAANLTSTGAAVGGLIGYAVLGTANGKITVTGSQATGDVRGTSSVGGFVGATNATASATAGAITIQNSSALGSKNEVSGTSNVGGFAGESSANTTLSGVTATGTASGTTSVGGLVGHNLGAITGTSSAKGVAVTATAGTNVGGLVGSNDGASASISNNSLIATTITVDSKTTNVGGWVGTNVNGAVIDGISVADVTINANGASNVGGLAGSSYGTISNSTVANSVIINRAGNNTGGLVGQLGTDSTTLTSNVTNSSSAANLTSTGTAVGGLIGYAVLGTANGTITVTGSQATGTVSGTSLVGGFVGATNATASATAGAITMQNSSAPGTAVSGTSNVGGFAGESSANTTLSGVTATGTVTGTTNVGGLVGHNLGAITGTSSARGAAVTATAGTNVGGLVGSNDGASASISGTVQTATTITVDSQTKNVGGLTGANVNGAVVNNVAVTDTTINANGASQVGGLVGVNQGTVRNSSVASSVRVLGAGGYLGGLAGLNDVVTVNGNIVVTGTISDSSSAMAVQGTGDYVGGLVGFNYGQVTNGSATGNVSGAEYVGGLIGANISNGTQYYGNPSATNIIPNVSGSSWSGTVSGTGTRYVGSMIGNTPSDSGPTPTPTPPTPTPAPTPSDDIVRPPGGANGLPASNGSFALAEAEEEEETQEELAPGVKTSVKVIALGQRMPPEILALDAPKKKAP